MILSGSRNVLSSHTSSDESSLLSVPSFFSAALMKGLGPGLISPTLKQRLRSYWKRFGCGSTFRLFSASRCKRKNVSTTFDFS